MSIVKDLAKVGAAYAVAAGATVLGFFGATKLVESIEKRSKKKDGKPEVEIPAGAKTEEINNM